MERFSGIPSGHYLLSLDHDEQDSEPETILMEDTESDTVLEVSSEISTIPGEIVQLISESSSDVELIEIISHETISGPDLLSPEQENERMRGEERYGHFHRVEAQQSAIQARLRRISEAIASESPASRQVRRRRFHEAVHGVKLW